MNHATPNTAKPGTATAAPMTRVVFVATGTGNLARGISPCDVVERIRNRLRRGREGGNEAIRQASDANE